MLEKEGVFSPTQGLLPDGKLGKRWWPWLGRLEKRFSDQKETEQPPLAKKNWPGSQLAGKAFGFNYDQHETLQSFRAVLLRCLSQGKCGNGDGLNPQGNYHLDF